MKKLFLGAAAAAVLFAGPAMVVSASAAPSYQVAQVELNIGGHGHDRDHRRVIVKEHRRCENVTVRTHRPNGTVVIRKERRCH